MDHSQLWNRYMECYDFLNGLDSYARNILDIATCTEAKLGSNILDAGSGTGNLSILLKACGARVTSCDFSASALAVHAKKDPTATLVKASLEESLPFADNTFDSICCASVLFALTQDGCSNAVKEFFRVLRPGGKVIVTAGTRTASLRRLVQMYFETLKKDLLLKALKRCIREFSSLTRVLYYNTRLRRIPDWQGFHLFSAAELEGILKQAGFTEVRIEATYGGCFLLAQASKTSAAPHSDSGNELVAAA